MSKQYQIVAGNKNEANELEGRVKTQKLIEIRNMFIKNMQVKLRVKNDNKKVPTRIVKGEIIQKNNYLIAVKTSSSVESFAFADFYTGRIKIIV